MIYRGFCKKMKPIYFLNNCIENLESLKIFKQMIYKGIALKVISNGDEI